MSLGYPEPPLTDDLILLRPWEEADAPALEEAARDEYVALIEHLPVPFDASGGDEWIRRRREHVSAGRGWSLAIVASPTSEVVGGIGLTFRHAPGVSEVGYWVLERERGRGIASRANRLLARWALVEDTGVARIEATVELWNAASIRTLEKAGFEREGLLRDYASWQGAREDVLLYSLIRDDVTAGAASKPPAGQAREM